MVRSGAPLWCLLSLFVCITNKVALAAPDAQISELHQDNAVNDDGRKLPPAAANISFIVTPANARITVGVTTLFAAAALADKGSTIPSVSCAWISRLPSVATMSSTGV